MDHPLIERTLRTGFPKPLNKPKSIKKGEYWDPIKWMKEMEKKTK